MSTIVPETKEKTRRRRSLRFSLRGWLLFFTLLPIGIYWWQRPFEIEVVIDNQAASPPPAHPESWGPFWGPAAFEDPFKLYAAPGYYRRETRTVRRTGWNDRIRHGVTRVYNQAGQKIFEELWRDDQRHGPYRMWSRTGQLIARGQFHRGKKHGTWKKWGWRGELIAEEEYDQGRAVGIWAYRTRYRGMIAPNSAEVRAWFAPGANDSSVNRQSKFAIQALSELLDSDDSDDRTDAAYLLGYLDDGRARESLARALNDAAERVRVAACTALGWIQPGAPAKPIIAKLCRGDSSIRVRIAAAEALARNDEDAVAAFRLGLAGENEYLREKCENALERLGKLKLPLPEKVYQTVSRQTYDRWLKAGKVERQATKAGTIYFEVVELVGMPAPPGVTCARGPKRFWYQTRIK